MYVLAIVLVVELQSSIEVLNCLTVLMQVLMLHPHVVQGDHHRRVYVLEVGAPLHLVSQMLIRTAVRGDGEVFKLLDHLVAPLQTVLCIHYRFIVPIGCISTI
jgi:hypothetical protein